MDGGPTYSTDDVPDDRARGLGLERRTGQDGHQHKQNVGKISWLADGRSPTKSPGDRPNSQCMAEREEKVKLRFQPPSGSLHDSLRARLPQVEAAHRFGDSADLFASQFGKNR